MKRLQKCVLVAVGATVLAGHLYAQPTSPAAKRDESQPVASRYATMSPEQMRREAQSLRDSVRVDIQRMHALQAAARRAKDVIKLTCVNDKFVKLKAKANLFDEAHRQLLLVSDTDERYPAYERVTAIADDVHKIREEADVCIGEPELTAESANDFAGPEIVDDPTLGLPFDIDVEPPAYASPYI